MRPLYIIAGFVFLMGFSACTQPEASGPSQYGGEVPEELLSISDSLQTNFGRRKNLPPGFEFQTLLALSYYPELKDVQIDFIVTDAFIPLSSRPYIGSLFKNRESRRYKVIISSGSLEAMEPVLLKNLPFNAQVAIIGHELGHTSHYQGMSVYGIQFVGLAYFCPAFRAWFEKGTDRRTIEHGLGRELLEYAEYVRNVFEEQGQQTNFMDRYYLNPDEIKTVMEELSFYN